MLTDKQHAQITGAVQMIIRELVLDEGIGLDDALAVLHAEMLGTIARHYGDDVAVAAARIAIRCLEGLPAGPQLAAKAGDRGRFGERLN